MQRRQLLALLGVSAPAGCEMGWRDPENWVGENGPNVAEQRYVRWGNVENLSVDPGTNRTFQLQRVDLPRPRSCIVVLQASIEPIPANGNVIMNFLEIQLDIGVGSGLRQFRERYVNQPGPNAPLVQTYEFAASHVSGTLLFNVDGDDSAVLVLGLQLSTVFDDES